MRATLLVPVLLLGSCATPPAPAAVDPVALLDHADPARREEGAARLALRKTTLQEALEGKLKALARSDDDSAAIRERLDEAAAERTPERMVWRAWHALRTGCLARDWKRLSGILSRQGLRLIEIYEPNERSKFVRFVAKSSAYVNDAGDRHHLFFWIQSLRRDDGVWVVCEVYAGLHAVFEAPFKVLAGRDRYRRDSVLARFFALPELPKVALVFPVLEEIELTYGRIRDKDADSAGAGFHVNAGFAMEAKAGGRSVYYTAEAGLDPREKRGGVLSWEDHVPSDTLGPLTPRGSGIWGAGGLKPVEEE
jgi:hypothetical protein